MLYTVNAVHLPFTISPRVCGDGWFNPCTLITQRSVQPHPASEYYPGQVRPPKPAIIHTHSTVSHVCRMHTANRHEVHVRTALIFSGVLFVFTSRIYRQAPPSMLALCCTLLALSPPMHLSIYLPLCVLLTVICSVPLPILLSLSLSLSLSLYLSLSLSH